MDDPTNDGYVHANTGDRNVRQEASCPSSSSLHLTTEAQLGTTWPDTLPGVRTTSDFLPTEFTLHH